MHNKQWNFYLNFGFVSGGKMTFDEIYPIILSGRIADDWQELTEYEKNELAGFALENYS